MRSPGALLPLLLLGLAACGGESDAGPRDMRVESDAAMDTTPAGTPAPPSLPVVAQDARRQSTVVLREWSVDPGPEALPAGEITLQVINTGSEAHTLAVEGAGVAVRSEAVGPGGTGALDVRLDAGTYRLFCPDGDHADRGMSVPLVVR